MFKPKRFVREYGYDKISRIDNRDSAEGIARYNNVMRIINAYERGSISADEAVMEIARA